LIDTTSLCQEIDARLREHAKPERKRVAVTYFPTSMQVIGVAVPDLRAIARDVSKRLHGEPAEDVFALVEAVIVANTFEGRQTTYEILSRHPAAMAALKPKRIERLGRGNDNWASVDAFSVTIAGPAWRKGLLDDETVLRWAKSPDRWWRRTALVCTVALNQKAHGGKGDTSRTLMICELLASDRDEMVAKALSWALRALSVVDREAVVAFLERHDAVLPSRVRREVGTKLATGLKSGRRT
jgi:3-methyladenine DNA glycosylase AlkD